ncbi:MAG: tRNA pseudouridine(55) synthase TruB [Spirochaetes bacterium]|nr:tRNA pseudouridine(55) synthase TruB [Spirochaetota bacterium]
MNKSSRHAGRGGIAPALEDAILLIDKQEGMTSYDTIRKVRRITGVSKAGHAGTLDRLASGLLVVCTGQATKLARFLLEDDKSYTGAVMLGIGTDTDDRDGNVTEERAADALTLEDILACARKFTGGLRQMPPRYSAVKINGKRASDRARGGEDVELAPRDVTVYDFRVLDFDASARRFFFSVRCSKGTYIRSLARDMGRELGTAAHLERLRRTGAGLFSIDDAVTLGELESYVREGVSDRRFILRPTEALRNYGTIVVGEGAARQVMNGAGFNVDDALKIRDGGEKTFIILDENENLIAIADVDIQKWLIKYLNVFNSAINMK